MNQAELLRRCKDDPAAVAAHARGVADYLLHLSDLVEGFVRLGSPLLIADKSHHVPVHVHDLVIEAVRRSQSTARNREVHVVATIPEPDGEDRSLEVLGNEALLAAMIESLVRDAVRRSPLGSQVELQVQVRGESILLRVRDRGTAVAASHLESAFDWYFEAPGAGRDAHRTGNLAIAKRVAEHHRGTISLRNHPEGGCEFQVALPRWRDPAPRSEDGALRSDNSRSPVRAQPLAR
jgi:signal transduction histidine kinase